MRALLRNRRCVTGMLFLVALTGLAAAQPDNTAPDKIKSAPRDPDPLKNLPPGAIIVVCDDLKTAQQLAPKLYVLTPKQYLDMLDKIEQSKTKDQPKEATPGECHLTGKVDGDVVRLQAEFKFLTDKEDEQVLLACRMGQPTSVSLDGALPNVQPPTVRGLVVRVEKKGEHVAKLDLEVNLASKGDRASERGFELDLPGAAVTSLDLELPDGVKEAALGVSGPARSSSRLVATHAEGKRNRLEQQLGAATSLEISWKGAAPTAFGPLSRTAQGTIAIRVTEQLVTTEAELTLKPRGQPAAEWRLHVPPRSQVAFKAQNGEDRLIGEIEKPPGPDETLRVVRLKEPTFDPTQVVVQAEQKRGQGPVAIGPFAVEGAARQRGDVLIAAPADVRLRVFPRGTLSPREVVAEEQRKDFKAAFTYWMVPAPEQAGHPFPPLLEVDADSSRGAIEASVEHTLQRTEENWKLRTVLTITPLAAGVDTLSLQVPADYKLTPGASRGEGPAYSVNAQQNRRVVDLMLEQRQTKQFKLTLEGTYPNGLPQERKVSLELPQLQKAVGRGTHKVVIQVLDNQELETPRERDPAWDIERSRYNRQTWTSERLPERVEFAWQPHRQELLLTAVADVALTGSMGQVVQHVWFTSGQGPSEVRLRAPMDVEDLQVLDGGEWDSRTRIITLARDVSEKQPLRVRYMFPVRGATFPVPLLAPAQEARCETKVRVTCETAGLVEFAGGPWEESRLETAPDGARWAALVLRGQRPETPPLLRLGEAVTLANVGVDRALIRVRVGEQNQQSYRASYLLTPASIRQLDIEFPASPMTLNAEIKIGGLPVSWGPVEDQATRPIGSDPARVARVQLGAGLLLKPTILDVWYQLGPGQLGGANAGWLSALGPLRTVLQAPRLCGDRGRGSVRWQVVLPGDWVPLCDDSSLPADLAWVWRGWLVGTRPTSSAAELERWLDERALADDSESPAASVVSWRTDLEPLTIRHAPQQAWLLGCSISLLAAALILFRARGRPVVFFLLLAGLAAGALAIALSWSGALSALIYGCEPGFAALFVIAVVQWLLHQRYRRQVVFLPSFKRVKASGSVVIPNGASRPREPSTVDAVPPVSSNQWATGGASPSALGRAQRPGSSQTKAPPV